MSFGVSPVNYSDSDSDSEVNGELPTGPKLKVSYQKLILRAQTRQKI